MPYPFRNATALLAGLLAFATLGTSCSYSRIGDLTVLANRNIGSTGDYELVQRGVKASAKMSNDDALERALDEATASVPGGEFLQNAQVYVKSNGKKVRVVGDVWGTKPQSQTGLTATDSDDVSAFKVGDSVTFRSAGQYVEGTIIGVNPEGAIVKYQSALKRERRKEVRFDALTLLGQEGTTLARQR